MSGCQRFLHQALGIPRFPGQAHLQVPAGGAPSLDGRTHLVVESLLAVQYQHCLALTHQP